MKTSFWERLWAYAISQNLTNWIPDRVFLKITFYLKMHKKLNLKNPSTYNEKLQWLKLYDHNALYTTLVDKAEVKEYVKSIIGEEYVIPSFGVWDRFEQIDFDSLPTQFVLKCTHDSGGLSICKDKASFDTNEARRKIIKCLKKNFYYSGREWVYKNVKPRIIAEQYMENSTTKELEDYKFFVFNGQVKLLFVGTNRFGNGETYFDFFDEKFNHLSFTHGHPNAPITPKKPVHFELMKELATKLAQGLPHVRVDLYEANNKVYFGEMTFYHHSGFVPFCPEEWDENLGQWLDLPCVE